MPKPWVIGQIVIVLCMLGTMLNALRLPYTSWHPESGAAAKGDVDNGDVAGGGEGDNDDCNDDSLRTAASPPPQGCVQALHSKLHDPGPQSVRGQGLCSLRSLGQLGSPVAGLGAQLCTATGRLEVDVIDGGWRCCLMSVGCVVCFPYSWQAWHLHLHDAAFVATVPGYR